MSSRQQDSSPPQTSEPTERIRSVERMFWIVFPTSVAIAVAGLLWWRLSLAQVTFAEFGLAFLSFAWLVWRYGIIAYSYASGDETATTRRAPLPREILTPLLIIAGCVFIVSATPTGIGAVTEGPADAAVSAYELAEATWKLVVLVLLVVFAIGALVSGLVRRNSDLAMGGGCFLLLIAFAYAGAYLLTHVIFSDDAYRAEWDKAFEPVRVLLDLFD